MEEMGVIQRSKSPWSSPLHMVPKSNGQWIPCGDDRRLNAVSEDDRCPLPHIQDFNNHLAGCTIFSKVDLVRGYHQIPVAPSSIQKTAVTTPFGLWEFLRMPFGLKKMLHRHSRGSWTEFYVMCLSPLYTSMISLLPATLKRNIIITFNVFSTSFHKMDW
ncbi:Pol polyprotein [Elysia marginata]|uniref:Pol polyprotein n=1 Tax=Elysia marginata TaxID=1093978 RepID=A0AAV4FTQ0_9GAST|nr:Pol polyprotein [Elysia marginata]